MMGIRNILMSCISVGREQLQQQGCLKFSSSWFCLVLCLWLVVSAKGEVIHYLPLDGPIPVNVMGGATVTNFGAEPTMDRNGIEASAYEFDGWSDYIYADINVNYDVLPQMTWGAWVRSDISHTTSTTRAIASQDDGSFDRHFGIDYREENGISAFKGDGVLGSYAQSEGIWYFVATTYNELNDQVKLYVAGQSDTSQTGFTVIAGALADVDDGHDYIHLGANPFVSVAEHWDGAIDDFFIYNEVLNLEDLAGIATNGIVIPEPSTWLLLLMGSYLASHRIRSKCLSGNLPP